MGNDNMRGAILLCLGVSSHAFKTPPPTPPLATLQRRGAVAGLLGLALTLPARVVAYDTIPSVDPDFGAMEKARSERATSARSRTAALLVVLKPLEAAKSEAEWIPACDNLALWVIKEGSIPEGIGVKPLVKRIREAYGLLPKRSYRCPATRTNDGKCYTPGPGAEAGYEALLKEIRTYSMVQVRVHAHCPRVCPATPPPLTTHPSKLRCVCVHVSPRAGSSATTGKWSLRPSDSRAATSRATPARAPAVSHSDRPRDREGSEERGYLDWVRSDGG